MEKLEEIIKELNDLRIIQKSMSWEEDIPEDTWNKYFKDNMKLVKVNLNPDGHRHYELSTSVMEMYNGFLGVQSITNLFSESSSPEDCYVTLRFFEMEEVKIISYREK
jgi:hypothetical protein